MKKLLLIVFILAVAGSAGGWYYMRKTTKDPEVRTAQVTRGDVVQAVQATGTHATSVTRTPSSGGSLRGLSEWQNAQR